MLFITTIFTVLFMRLTITSINAAPALLHASNNTGSATFFAPGLGACGWGSSLSDDIVAVSSGIFDSFGSESNGNPVCGKALKATYGKKSITVKVVDKCMACDYYDLDFSPSAFSALASEDAGRLEGVKWHWL